MRMEGGAERSALTNRSTMATADEERRRGPTVCVCLSFHKREIRRSASNLVQKFPLSV